MPPMFCNIAAMRNTALLAGLGVLLAVGLGACADVPAAPESSLEPTQMEGVHLRYVATPDGRLMYTNAALLDPEAGLDATVLQGTHNLTDGLAVRFQPSTGRTDYLRMPGGSGSWSVLPMGGGEAYLGSHQHGYLYHLAPGDTALRRIDLPRPTDDSYSWIFGLDRASDGNLYLGTYPEGALLRYDPRTDTVDELGVVLPSDDGRAQYLRNVNGRFPGTLYLGMGAHPELVAYDLATGAKTRLLPEAYQDRSFVYYSDRLGDWLVAAVSPNDAILLFDPERRTLERTIDVPGDGTLWRHNYESLFLHEGEVFFGTDANYALWAHDLDADTTRLVGTGLGAPFGLAQDRYLFTRDYYGTYRIIDLDTEEVVVERTTRFEGDGMELHALAEGPDATVVGGIYINQGFFHYDPAADTLFAPGAAVSFGGQIDALAAHGDTVYLGHYTTARLSVYDPTRPWQPGHDAGANPRLVGSAGEEQDRFPAAVVGPDGKVYLGTIPKYGKLGGALVVYDPATDSLTTYRNIVPDQSVYALVATDSLIYGGTAVMGGLGAAPTASAATLFAWDPATQQKAWERTPVPDARELWGLDRMPDGTLVGGADSTLFRYDAATDSLLATRPAAVPEVITKLVASRDGWIYGLTEERFFRASSDLRTVQTLDVNADYWDSLVETSAGRLFVGRGANLYEVVRTDAAPSGTS